MTYIILTILIIALAILSYFIFKKDILSPSFISTVMYAICSICAFIGTFSWNKEKQISVQLIIIIVLGLVAFIVGEILARKLYKKKNTEDTEKQEFKVQEIEIASWKWISLIAFVVLTIVLIIIEIKKVCAKYGFESNNIFELLKYYRGKSTVYSNEIATNYDINFIVRQMRKIAAIFGIFDIYVIVNNFFAKCSKKKMIYPIILLILCLINTLMFSGGRAIMIHFLVSLVFLFMFFYIMKNKKISKKFIIGCMSAALCIVSLFYIVLPLTGRKTNSNIIDYSSFYLGASIPSFNIYLKKKPTTAQYALSNTFEGIYESIDRVHIVDFKSPKTVWVKFGKTGSSNIYTAMKTYYSDLGIAGVIIFQIIAGFAISILYLYIRKHNNKKSFILINYAYYFYILIDQIRGERFYKIFTFPTITYFIFFVIINFYFFKFSFKEIPVYVNSIKEKIKTKLRRETN